MIHVVNPKYRIPEGSTIVNTTSRSTDWSRGLSPFVVGPVELYDGYVSQNMENAWQFSKVYGHTNHVDDDLNPTSYYFEWAKKGWADTWAHRYPMGRDVKPLYSWWAGEKLGYVEARKRIYIPLYSTAVRKTSAYEQLQKVAADAEELYLVDFDAHNLTPGTFDYETLWNNPAIKVGHGYVLAMLLEGLL